MPMQDDVLDKSKVTPMAVPPHQWWRIKWYSPIRWELRPNNPPRHPFQQLHPVMLNEHEIVVGPICPTAQLAEERAREFMEWAQRWHPWYLADTHYDPIKTDEHGDPL